MQSCSQPCISENSNTKKICMPHTPTPPQSQSCDDSVTKSMADSDLFHLSIEFLTRYCFLCAWRTAVLTHPSVFLVLQ